MTNKPVVIKLTWRAGIGGGKDYYVVTKVVNSTEYRPGSSLTKDDVDGLIARRNWRVEVSNED